MHPYIHISHGSMSANIDVMIAPLIKLMWEAGIETVESCQDSGDGWAVIHFYGIEQPQKFLKMVHEPVLVYEKFEDCQQHVDEFLVRMSSLTAFL